MAKAENIGVVTTDGTTTRTKTIDDNKVMDLFMKIIEQLLDDNQRLKIH